MARITEQMGRTSLMAAAHLLPTPSTRAPSISWGRSAFMVAAIKGIRSSALGSARMEGGGGGSSRGWKERGGGMRCRAAAGCALGRGAAVWFLLGSARLQGAGGGSPLGWKEPDAAPRSCGMRADYQATLYCITHIAQFQNNRRSASRIKQIK